MIVVIVVDKEQLRKYQEYYFANGLDVPFKLSDNNYIVYIKPISVKMFAFYKDSVGILKIDKNKTPDPTIISKSYLQYLAEDVIPQSTKDANFQQMLVTILNLSLGEEYTYVFGYNEKQKIYLGIKKDDVLLAKITAKEFDKISEIILFYNDPNYDDTEVSEDIRKAAEEYYSLKFKNQYMPTLEEKKAFLSFKSGLTLQQINEMTYRFFEIAYSQCVNVDTFFSQKILQASEKYKVDDLVYPLFKKKETPFDFLQDAETFKNTLSKAAQA